MRSCGRRSGTAPSSGAAPSCPRGRRLPLGPHILWPEIATKSTPSACTSTLHVRRGLRRVADKDRALLVRPRHELVERVDRPERVRDETRRDDLDAAPRARVASRPRGRARRASVSGISASSAPVFPAMYCHGTKFEWCSSSVTTTRSPGPRFERPHAYATRLIASVALRTKMMSRTSRALTS